MAPVSKPSFLEAYHPPADDAPETSSLPGNSSSGDRPLSASVSRSSSSVSSSSSRRRKQWNSSSSVDGLVVYSVGLVLALGTGAYFAWRRWQQRLKARSQQQQAQPRATASSSGQASGRSAFTFDKTSRGSKQQQRQQQQRGAAGSGSAAVVIKQPPIPPVSTLQQQPLRAGNPKKDKALRKERKAMKEARKQAVRDQAEQVQVAAARAADVTAQTKEDPTRVTYIDYDKTADAFQRVKDWQETGKKRFD